MIVLHELQPCSALERVDARNNFEEIDSTLHSFGHAKHFTIAIDEHQRQSLACISATNIDFNWTVWRTIQTCWAH
jgi:hypothetical protein